MNLNDSHHSARSTADGSVSRGAIPEADFTPIQHVLGDLARGASDQRRTIERLEEAARQIVDEARNEDLQPEEMLVRVKKRWANVAEIRRSTPDDGLGEVQARLITECIRAFYGDAESRRAS